MRILVEQSGYPLANLGDISMLQVAIARLRCLWPNALIEVFTSAPERLEGFCPGTQPLSITSRNIWYYPLIGRLYKLLPDALARFWDELEWKLRQDYPSTVRGLMQLKIKAHPDENQAFQAFTEALYKADLVIATGGGYITDEFEEIASTVLGVLGVASKLGKPTVMLGQGLGPLEKPKLRTQAKYVLSRVNLITLREKQASFPLLNSLGVSSQRIITTGDDAIELAYQAYRPKLENGIGINLRIAHYSAVNSELLEVILEIVQEVARAKHAPLVPVPISEYDSDAEAIQQILKGYEFTLDRKENLDAPLKVIKQIGRCRVVVTGSYHAGVFALSQGIPVVGLAKSQYYIDKFLGLAEQFGIGCEIVLLNNCQLRENLIASIERAWLSAENIREQLLIASKKQIELGHAAYQKIYNLI